MTIGVIDPYDIALRVDLGEIRESDLPKVFSGDTKGLAECKRHLYKLRSDRILQQRIAILSLHEKLKYMTTPQGLIKAIAQTTGEIKMNITSGLEHYTSVTARLDRYTDTSIEYSVVRTRVGRTVNRQHWNIEDDVILQIKNTANGSEINPVKGWNKLISKPTFDKVVGKVREINHFNENIIGTRQRRIDTLDLLENKTIPLMARLWGVALIGDILEMLGKALGGNL